MDVENPNEFLEGPEKKGKPKKQNGASEDAGHNRDAEDTRSVNPQVRPTAGKGRNATVQRGRS